jgi:hypothetical protein
MVTRMATAMEMEIPLEMVSVGKPNCAEISKISTGNDIGSGNTGFSVGKVRKSQTLGNYVGTIIDDTTTPLNPGSSNTIWTVGSPSNNGNGGGSSNSVGSGNTNK